jgi:hypothetical protein
MSASSSPKPAFCPKCFKPNVTSNLVNPHVAHAAAHPLGGIVAVAIWAGLKIARSCQTYEWKCQDCEHKFNSTK